MTQGMRPFCHGKRDKDDQLFRRDVRPGDRLDIALPVGKGGRYRVDLTLTKARDYAIVQLYLDGKKAGDPIDLYNPEVTNSKPIPPGTHDLSAGEHKLTVEITGANEKAVKAYMFGLDTIHLKPAK